MGDDGFFLDEVKFPSPGNPGPAVRLQNGLELGQYFIYKYAGLDENGKWLIYDKNNEISGADWALHVAQTAQQLGVLDRVAKTTDLNAPASRELVAELLFQGIQKAQVTYTPAFGYVTDKVIGAKTNSLGEKNFKLDSAKSSDKWGRPATKWTYNTGDKATTFVEKPDLTYTKAVTECDVAHDAGLKVDTAYTLYVNVKKQT